MTNTTVDGYYVFATCTAALLARIVTHPMDTVKTRLQVINSDMSNSRMFLNRVIFKYPHKSPLYSLLTLYQGLPITLLFSIPAFSVYLSCYEVSKQWLDKHTSIIKRDSISNHLISASAAEIAAGVLFTPMEVMKNRLQTSHTNHSGSMIKHILETEGVRGFFRGYWMGLVVFVPHSMAYFVVYERLKKWFIHRENPASFQTYMICSSIAGTLSIILSTPLDIIKTRWQISSAEHGQHYRNGPIAIARDMLLKESKGAFTRGLGARIVWGIPTTAISMTVFEVLKDKRDSINIF